MNPFLSPSMLNRPLSAETCQTIIFRAATTNFRFPLRPAEDMLGLRDLAHVYGREVYLLDRFTAAQLFERITLAVYQEVERLFCAPIFRSHRTVWLLLSKLAEEVQVLPPSPEAIWAICGDLSTARDERVGPWVTPSDTRWYVDQVIPDVLISSGAVRMKPEITCIIDEQLGKVVAFHRRKVGEAVEEAIATTLYDALCAQRQPAPLTPGGLVWSPPRQLRINAVLPQHVADCGAELGVSILGTAAHHPIIDDLQGVWARTLTGRILSAERFDLMLDTYLKKRYGHGPQTTADDADYAFRRLDGYNRDPALVLPPLRWLLPVYNATIDEHATVIIASRRYHDDLLRYWPGSPVTVRVSRHNPDFAYIYLDGEILCQASQAS